MVIAFIPIMGTAKDPLQIENIRGGWGVKAEIANDGDFDLYNVSWSIRIDGGIIFLPYGRLMNNTIPRIIPGATERVRTPVFGFGKTIITVSAWISGYDPIKSRAVGYVLGPFVLIW